MSETITGDVPLDTEPAPQRRGTIAVAILTVAALVAGALFAITTLADDGNDPEDAVKAMLAAAAEEDVLGVLEQLDPSERDAIRPGLSALVDELERLGVLGDADLGGVSGVDLAFDDVRTATRVVNDHVARVRLTGGRAAYRFRADKLPLGAFLRELLGDDLGDTSSAGDDERLEDGGEEDNGVTTVKRGGRWYVSIAYSVAEAGRQLSGRPIGEIRGIAAKGASSPEQAIRDLLTAAAGLDVQRLLELLPPDEMAAVHEYAGLFLDAAEGGAAEARRQVKADVTDVKLRTAREGDEALVSVVSANAIATSDGAPVFELKDGCVTIKSPPGEPPRGCAGDDPRSLLDQLGVPFGTNVLPPALDVDKPELGFVTVKVGGSWYVSPTRTVLRNLVALLRVLDGDDLEHVRDFVEQTITQATSFMTSATYGEVSARVAVPVPVPRR